MKLILLCTIAGVLAAGLLALGVWQLERRVWKLDLIQKIDQRVGAPLVDVPPPSAWPSINASNDAYRHVRASGEWLADRDTRVQAVTALGGGYWLMTPLRTDAGFVVLVNRGFVAAENKAAVPVPQGRAEVTGLLRVTEPKGGFLRSNDPAAERWFSRDIAAIAQARGLTDVAPYFIDAAAVPGQLLPVGGLTVISLPNSHLVYAITWFVLAAMVIGFAVRLLRRD
ncbi:SURF1 family protein [Tardiphaga sp.]|uniref:SURF1 family protein n=1 Tax=Tardiphaga sp. TaxID=1926292 RepID=UPI002614BC04|nr:SURF1 family protein [Tardiphaga sp.]